LPHSEIRGSTGASPSSRLIAACYVLHRLRTPRHPPDALALTLDRSALVSHARRRTQDMERDHWIEIFKINRCANRPIPPSLCQRAEYGVWIERSERHAYSKTLFRQRTTAIEEGQLIPGFWWSRSGSNRRPQACKARALPTELRPPGQQLQTIGAQMVGPGRVERPTSRLSGVRSNHLSYEPETPDVLQDHFAKSIADPDRCGTPLRADGPGIRRKEGKRRRRQAAIMSKRCLGPVVRPSRKHHP
jgi:hypothetical protein